MKAALVLVTLGLALLADAAPQFVARPEIQPPVYKHEQRDDFGQYSLSFLTNEGLRVTEHSQLKRLQDGTETKYVPVIQGEYQYTGRDGIPVHLRYVADENGYQPVGDHLPVAPAIPVA